MNTPLLKINSEFHIAFFFLQLLCISVALNSKSMLRKHEPQTGLCPHYYRFSPEGAEYIEKAHRLCFSCVFFWVEYVKN